VRDIFVTRAKLLRYLRNFLDMRGFLEVETPVMTSIAGGAIATPFVTFHKELKRNMFMRIAPELYLKQLVIGGMERVYEIGKQFRNEGIDHTHNPEFTTCEFYMAHADYRDLMSITEDLLSGALIVWKSFDDDLIYGGHFFSFGLGMVKEITGGLLIRLDRRGSEQSPMEINFTPPFRKLSVITTLEEHASLTLPEELHTEEARRFLSEACEKRQIHCPPPRTSSRLLDKLIGKYVEPLCMDPTFLYDHPLISSPLAKRHRKDRRLSERFELFVAQHELCNAYTELNDPEEQRERFLQQAKSKENGDEETHPIDEHYCIALEYGLPPTAGWGIGIDRMCMLLTNTANIKETILFPVSKPTDTEPSANIPRS